MDIAKKIAVSRWPEVYNMNSDEFKNWVLSLSIDDEEWMERKIVNVIFKENFKTPEEVDSYIEDMTLSEKGMLNKEKLFYQGVGPNFFMFNEQDSKGLVLNNNTLYDYDRSTFLEQERIIAEHNESHKKESYEKESYKRLKLFHDWCRLMVNSRLVYGCIDSLGAYVYERLEETLDREIEKIYPYEFVDGPDHGKAKDGGFIWDLAIDAQGKEKQLEELKDRIFSQYFYKDFFDRIMTHCESLQLNCVFVKRGKDEDGVSDFYLFIVSDREVAKKINLDNFYSDVIENESQNWEAIESIIRSFEYELLNKLTKEYKEVESMFENNIVPFKKKKGSKIVVSAKALEALKGLDDDP